MARVLVTRILPEGGLDPLVARGHDIVQGTDDVAYSHDADNNALFAFDGVDLIAEIPDSFAHLLNLFLRRVESHRDDHGRLLK